MIASSVPSGKRGLNLEDLLRVKTEEGNPTRDEPVMIVENKTPAEVSFHPTNNTVFLGRDNRDQAQDLKARYNDRLLCTTAKGSERQAKVTIESSDEEEEKYGGTKKKLLPRLYNNPPVINDSKTTAKQREVQAGQCLRDRSKSRNPPESESSEDSYLEEVFDKVYKKKARDGLPNKKKGSIGNNRTRIEDQSRSYRNVGQSDDDNDDNEMYGWPRSKLISLLNKNALQMKGMEEALNMKEENIQNLSSRMGEKKSKGKELRKFSKEVMGELDRLYRDYGFLKEDLAKSQGELEALRVAKREQEREVEELSAVLVERNRQLKDSEHKGKNQTAESSEQYRIIGELREMLKFAEKEREARGREADTRMQVMESQFSGVKDDWLNEK
jgi:hypothetical protein